MFLSLIRLIAGNRTNRTSCKASTALGTNLSITLWMHRRGRIRTIRTISGEGRNGIIMVCPFIRNLSSEVSQNSCILRVGAISCKLSCNGVFRQCADTGNAAKSLFGQYILQLYQGIFKRTVAIYRNQYSTGTVALHLAQTFDCGCRNTASERRNCNDAQIIACQCRFGKIGMHCAHIDGFCEGLEGFCKQFCRYAGVPPVGLNTINLHVICISPCNSTVVCVYHYTPVCVRMQCISR